MTVGTTMEEQPQHVELKLAGSSSSESFDPPRAERGQDSEGLRGRLAVVFKLFREKPYIPIVTFCILVVLLVPSIVGLVVAKNQEIESSKEWALEGSCLEAANNIQNKLDSTFNGVRAMVSWIRNYPDCRNMDQFFMNMSSDIRNFDGRSDLFQLEADVSGVIWYIEPPVPEDLHWLYGYNLLNPNLTGDDFYRRAGLLQSPGKFTFDGPDWQPDGFSGGYAIYAIYLPAEGPDQDMGCEYLGPEFKPDPAYTNFTWDPVRKLKFWGLVQGMVDLQMFYNGSDPAVKALTDTYNVRIAISEDLEVLDFNYKRRGEIILETNPPPSSPVHRSIVYENINWKIEIEPKSGWTPNWFVGCVVCVVIGSILVSLLIMWMLIAMELRQSANKELEQSISQLAETTQKLQQEKLATDELVKRQLKLIACLETDASNAPGISRSVKDSVQDRIEDVRRNMKPAGAGATEGPSDEIVMIRLLGEGSFGKVYQGTWRNSCVAIKSIILPANMSGATKREKMAVMEAAISSSLSHPNIVQTYTYDIMRHEDSSVAKKFMYISPADSRQTGMSEASSHDIAHDIAQSGIHSLEVRIVLEYCDKGSLRAALDSGIFKDAQGQTNYLHVVETAAEIARAMSHLHHANVLHGDLKTINVLMKSDGSMGRGFIAKIADFGLSVHIDQGATHMSNVFHGTLTHMSPEVLLKGRLSKSTDVYAFGITMWELLTGEQPFEGMQAVKLGHGVAMKRWRPSWPGNAPLRYRLLAEKCWSQAAEDRPSFDEAVNELNYIIQETRDNPFLFLEPVPRLASHTKAVSKKSAGSLNLSAMMGSKSDSVGPAFTKAVDREDKIEERESESESESEEEEERESAREEKKEPQSPTSIRAQLRPGGPLARRVSPSSTPPASGNNNGALTIPPGTGPGYRPPGTASQSLDVLSVVRSLGSERMAEVMEEEGEGEGQI